MRGMIGLLVFPIIFEELLLSFLNYIGFKLIHHFGAQGPLANHY